MADLAQRLLAAIDAKAAGAEEAAASAKGGRWRARPSRGPDGFVTLDDRAAVDMIAARCSGIVARFIADNDPETVLRRCAADRRTVERHANFDFPFVGDQGGMSEYASEPYCDHCHHESPCPDLVDLAVSYGITEVGSAG